jgi:zinc transport system ATP-binding protein
MKNGDISPDVPAVAIRGLSARYESPEAIIEGANLTIAQGEFFALIGPNGGGKTTLVKIILGLLEPSAGTVQVFGGSVHSRRSLIGYVPQFATCRRDFPITVRRMVQLALQSSEPAASTHPEPEDRTIDAALDRVGMLGQAQLRLSELSGGQLQRALIAQALVRKPRLLILDEPTASIDPGGETTLFNLFEELSRSMTILLVSHDVHYVMRAVGRVACVNRKVVVHEATDLEGMDTRALYGGMLKPVVHNHDLDMCTPHEQRGPQ